MKLEIFKIQSVHNYIKIIKCNNNSIIRRGKSIIAQTVNENNYGATTEYVLIMLSRFLEKL